MTGKTYSGVTRNKKETGWMRQIIERWLQMVLNAVLCQQENYNLKLYMKSS